MVNGVGRGNELCNHPEGREPQRGRRGDIHDQLSVAFLDSDVEVAETIPINLSRQQIPSRRVASRIGSLHVLQEKYEVVQACVS